MAKSTPSSSSQPSGTPAFKKSTSSTGAAKNQKTLHGFFQRTVQPGSASPKLPERPSQIAPVDATRNNKRGLLNGPSSTQSLTPAPSSDGPDIVPEQHVDTQESAGHGAGLLSPVTPANESPNGQASNLAGEVNLGTPSRKAKKAVNYAESASEEGDDDEDLFRPKNKRTAGRAAKKRRVVESSDEDNYEQAGSDQDIDDDDLDDFIVADDSYEEVKPTKKRKRTSEKSTRSSPSLPSSEESLELAENAPSTARQWTYDPANVQPLQPRSANAQTRKPDSNPMRKQKAHMTEPDQRYPWLASIMDIDKHPPDHPDYDPRTIYIPPLAWTKFSPFEKQYWEIKQKFWDTIVFFKKGKFYELYENDATIGHQLFDLKLTDRVNMRMVGVPEMSLDHWATQFVAKGFKIARVDQQENALGKEMRERDEKGTGNAKKGKDDKVIKRELACVLTAGTLVDGSMLQDDMSTYCAAIKESSADDSPTFGICFVDTATGQFHLTEFADDPDYTKFETFVAQTRPQELLLEKGSISVRSLRILKNNTGPTTIWNYLKPGKEFWEPHITCKELDASDFFSEGEDGKPWPTVLLEAKKKDLLMSAFGALMQYLRMLKIERDLITMGNFTWYDPIRKASSLVLDGQTLINLEVFANSFDGGQEGTLFQLLNRCVTPFGKRMFKQWVCHPLMDIRKIEARLDAVDSLNADSAVRDRFTSQMTKMPDLERLISRVHAGNCKTQDFVRVLEGFEQIDYTMGLLKSGGSDGEGVIGQLINVMPDLDGRLQYWKTAFDRTKAKENGILVPERGVEDDFDASQDAIEEVQAELDRLLKKVRADLKSNAICYRDNGKEIFQLEVPVKVKGVPAKWDQVSATKQVKRYYFPELRSLVRKLQETQETHSQIVKQVAGRFYQRFDENYDIWLASVRVIAQLDCLISLAKASNSLGQPSCRPTFVDGERSVLEFEDLRHPCMLPNATDFIPNDVALGGEAKNVMLLTGANAAGKSTVLRMTCIAVIMAQIGCHLPCTTARLTPCDRIMSRLGANDNIFAAQSTFFVELAETKKILSEASPRSLVILDELGRGTSSYDGVAVAQAVLHHIATHIGCIGFFATHYHSLATEFEGHPEITPKRMKILVDDDNRRVTFLYKLEEGVAEGSFGMHCASMCGIPDKVVQRAEIAAKEWEHTSRLKESLEKAKSGSYIPLGFLSDVAAALNEKESFDERGLNVLIEAIKGL